MRILAIETSCDETGIAILETRGTLSARAEIKVLSNITLSQAALHAHYGGVFPALARREHAKSIVPLIIATLAEAKLAPPLKTPRELTQKESGILSKIFHKEPELFVNFKNALLPLKKPAVDAIAVTSGPGLEPALWVGINTAQALGALWGIPVIPVNHMEGHILASLLVEKLKKRGAALQTTTYQLTPLHYPSLALLISGGHTELVLMPRTGSYKLLGQTRDDAVGEAFDKVARMLGLTYPGGPEISKLAEKAPVVAIPPYPLPRPMLKSGDFDFSFSGLKTAVLYTIRKIQATPLEAGARCEPSRPLTWQVKASIAKEFEDAVTEILLTKTLTAAKKYKAKEIILGGGVTANKKIRAAFRDRVARELPDATLFIPSHELSTDNALMIGVAGLMRSNKPKRTIRANSTMRLSKSIRPTLAQLRKKK